MKATMYLGFVCLWIFLFSSAVESSCKYFMHLFFCFDFKFLTLRPSNVAWSLFISFFSVDSFTPYLLQSYLISGHKIVSSLRPSLNARLLYTFVSNNKHRVHGEVSQQNWVSVRPAGKRKSVSYLETSHQMVASSRLLAVLTLVR